ncbi:MAG: hypothetical protein A3J93_03165 [Candidatus Magasanikbacteria bacterium RIFOXYC2_FULL_42_28]|uniref:Putative pre-16S rRNA nuclease n=1 Tax=Candidatus Magasanikbacteria bacterium RIFOXYC2_FULL_42_28 TaxID=1798704 RepID=A0A1F6NUB2_9BACT|nr:MAG: hypothetical protein A3J93_03165 [Candidatus Magasanikbacteria bacterium RIFOXYC2_FULL_42_28]
MNILALDYGQKNIGLAWCDTGIGAPLPFGVIKGGDFAELVKVIKTENIDKVIIGLPLGMDGKEKANTARVREFGEQLKKQITASVEFFDERFSSQQADRSEGGVSRDEKSAMIILESYLASVKNSKL